MTPAYNPDDPFNDEERERLQVEALARKFENKYVRTYNLFIHARICCYKSVQSSALKVFIGIDYPLLTIADKNQIKSSFTF